MQLKTPRYCRHACAGLLVLAAMGCSSANEEHADDRRSAYAHYNEAVAAFASKDFATAEANLTSAIDAHGLNPSAYSDAMAKRAYCHAKAGKFAEANADLEKLGPSPENLDQVLVVRSYILRKQGKAAESRTSLAKAKRLNPAVREFKD
jgi:outer membrane protein assembly factor BamD (BamD/ComL family)